MHSTLQRLMKAGVGDYEARLRTEYVARCTLRVSVVCIFFAALVSLPRSPCI